MNTPKTTVYVRLLEEGLNVWKPVPATPKNEPHIFQLGVPDNYSPETENLEFKPGTIVICEFKQLSDGQFLVAVKAA